jgi:hypothetical protein
VFFCGIDQHCIYQLKFIVIQKYIDAISNLKPKIITTIFIYWHFFMIPKEMMLNDLDVTIEYRNDLNH